MGGRIRLEYMGSLTWIDSILFFKLGNQIHRCSLFHIFYYFLDFFFYA